MAHVNVTLGIIEEIESQDLNGKNYKVLYNPKKDSIHKLNEVIEKIKREEVENTLKKLENTINQIRYWNSK